MSSDRAIQKWNRTRRSPQRQATMVWVLSLGIVLWSLTAGSATESAFLRSPAVAFVDRLVSTLPPESVLRAKAEAERIFLARQRATDAQARAENEASSRQQELVDRFRDLWPEVVNVSEAENCESRSDRTPGDSVESVGRDERESVPGAISDDIENPVASPVEQVVAVQLSSAEREILVADGAERFARSLADSASEFELRPAFLLCVMKIESNFEPGAVSRAGAVGLMQLMPTTAEELGANPWDISDNISGGARLINELLGRYEGDVTLAMAAYNAGPGAVAKYGGVPPYPETRKYVDRVVAECPDPRP